MVGEGGERFDERFVEEGRLPAGEHDPDGEAGHERLAPERERPVRCCEGRIDLLQKSPLPFEPDCEPGVGEIVTDGGLGVFELWRSPLRICL